jgi:hypothetical protein
LVVLRAVSKGNSMRRVRAVPRQGGEGAEAAGVFGDQLGVPFVDQPGYACPEMRVVLRTRDRHGHRHELGGNLVAVHVGERGIRCPPHGDAVAAGHPEPPARDRRHGGFRHAVSADINTLSGHYASLLSRELVDGVAEVLINGISTST